MTVITMSRKELARLQTLIALAERRTRIDDAAALLGMSRRQVYRLLQEFRAGGPEALVSKRRGKPSNHAHGPVLRKTVLGLVRELYEDFGPTLAAEKLREVHGLPVGVETLRQWMVADGLWVRRRDRVRAVHQPRHRRDCLGELIQIDGSEHHWFEDRGPMCTLLDHQKGAEASAPLGLSLDQIFMWRGAPTASSGFYQTLQLINVDTELICNDVRLSIN